MMQPFHNSSSFGVDLMYNGIESIPNDEEPFFNTLKHVIDGLVAVRGHSNSESFFFLRRPK
jgi:hypothetical protein